MVNIYDLMDADELVKMVKEGYVRVQRHPVYPYNIACYTKQAMFERVWNDVTLNCRGLIYDQNTGEIIARPFKKFFNYEEPNAPVFAPDDWVTVFDKVDGSLGIAYDTPDGPAIATKGSFTSDQALHATELLRAKYPLYQTDDYCTDLFEIIYPENRIVLDYGETDELRYLGSVQVETGEDYWNGILIGYYDIPKNGCLTSGRFSKVIEEIDLHRPNAEGVVILNQDTGERVKMKQGDYIELHRVMTGLNERQLWEWLNDGLKPTEVMAKIPEEMHGWATPIIGRIIQERYQITKSVGLAYRYHSKESSTRKEFAAQIKDYPSLDKGIMFCWLDGQNERASELIWKAVKP